jgi:signal transduction histidine kinase
MSNQPEANADNVGEPAGLLKRMLTYAAIGMMVSIAVQFGLLMLWMGDPQAHAREWLALMGVSILFLGVVLYARRLALRNRMAWAVSLLFIAVCVAAVLVVVLLPSALGLALIAPAFGLILSLPYVSRGTFLRMSVISIALVLVMIPISAFLGVNQHLPTPLENMVQSLPLFISAIMVVVLIRHMHGWLAGTLRELRETRTQLELKVAERTEALQLSNETLHTEVSQRAAIQQHLSIQKEYLSALHELSLGVINCLDRETMLDAIVTRACQLMDTPHAFIGLLDDAGEQVIVAVAKGLFTDMLAQGGPALSTSVGAAGQQRLGDMPIIIDDYERWPLRLPMVPAGIKACAIYPLTIHENKTAGVLVMAYDAPKRRFDADQQEALTRLAELASIAYSNILLYETVRQNEHELETRVADRTVELSTLLGVAQNLSATLDMPALLRVLFDQISWLIDYNAGSIFEVQEMQMHTLHHAGPEFSSYKPGVRWPLSGHHLELARTGKPIIIGDVRSDEPMAVLFRQTSQRDWLGEVPAHIVSWVGVPMKVKDRVIGILTLDSAKPHHFNARHAELLMAVAQQAALALENARLYNEAAKSAAQAERSRLARDLHDSVSQAIYGIVLASRTLEKLADPADLRMAAPLQHILSLSDAAMAEIRALIFELRPESLEREGILSALRKQADAIRARYGIAVEITLCEAEPDVPLAIKEACYRIAQEAMHNTVKHARARHLWLSLACDHIAGTLEVRDDGVGFDVRKACPSQMGMGTMRERAQSVGGRLEIESKSGEGTVVRAYLPIKAAAVMAESVQSFDAGL